jgi:hypothetical protein
VLDPTAAEDQVDRLRRLHDLVKDATEKHPSLLAA